MARYSYEKTSTVTATVKSGKEAFYTVCVTDETALDAIMRTVCARLDGMTRETVRDNDLSETVYIADMLAWNGSNGIRAIIKR